MSFDIHQKLLQRVERRLITRPRFAALNALLLSQYAAFVGIPSVLLNNDRGIIDGVAYWALVFWSVLVCAHAGVAYLNSGAWKRARERYVQEEILDAEDIFDLDEDEMIRLHLEISAEVQQRANVFTRLLLSGLCYVALWPGMMMVVLLLRFSPDFANLFRVGLLISLLGTALLGFTLPFRQIFNRSQQQSASLAEIYGAKRKQKRSQSANSDRLSGTIGDDGEFIAEDAAAAPSLRNKAGR